MGSYWLKNIKIYEITGDQVPSRKCNNEVHKIKNSSQIPGALQHSSDYTVLFLDLFALVNGKTMHSIQHYPVLLRLCFIQINPVRHWASRGRNPERRNS